MKILQNILLCLILFVTGCYQLRVGYDYDKEVDFAKFNTFNWFPVPKKEKPSSLMEKRLMRKVDSRLAEKGFKKVEENPDFLVVLHGLKQTKIDIRDWGYSCDRYGYGWGVSGGIGTANRISVYQYEEGTIILDFVDAKSNELFWRGVTIAVIDHAQMPEEWEHFVNEAVTRMLINFPPSLKK